MKSNPTVENILKTEYAVQARPQLVADWNLNRYFLPTADNIPTEKGPDSTPFDEDIFPIDSICLPNRPSGGIAKARIDASITSDDYNSDIESRFYIANVDDVYKYWTSPQPTDGTGIFPLHTDGDTVVRPFVTYNQTINANKIVVKTSAAWATPNDFDIRVMRGGSWVTISTSPVVGNDGTITIYFNGTGWSSTRPAVLVTDSFSAVMVRVRSMKGGKRLDGSPVSYQNYNNSGTTYTTVTTDGTDSHFDLIAIEAHYEADLSDRLISVSDTFDTSDVSELYPIGTLTTNTATINLSNEDGFFNNENTNSPLYKIVRPNAQFTLSYIYTVDGSDLDPVQQFSLYGGPWNGQRDVNVSVELSDYSKFFNTVFPRPALWENLTVSQIVWRLLNSVGFVDFTIDEDDRVTDHIIPVFYVTGEQNIWEVLDDLAKASQSAIFFDSYGKLRVKTRTAAFDNAAAPVWTFNSNDTSTQLADLQDLTQTEEIDVNKLTVTYSPARWLVNSQGVASLSKVWEPDGTVTLRASQVTHTVDLNATEVYVHKDDIIIWPFAGLINVEGEIIEFEGKEYVYFVKDSSGNLIRTVGNPKSTDEQAALDKKTPARDRYKNHFTGGLKIKTRGMWESDPIVHEVDATGYSVRRIRNGHRDVDVKGLYFHPQQSTITLHAKKFKTQNDLLIATRGGENQTGFYVYGTRFKFDSSKGFKDRQAGIVINNSGTTEDGYYVDIISTLGESAKKRQQRNEVVIYTVNNGKRKSLSHNGGKGSTFAIQDDRWYDIDLFFQKNGDGTHSLRLLIDGITLETVTVSGADRNTPNGKFGMYIKGDTKADFEYLYGIATPMDAPVDDEPWYSIVKDGYASSMWDREWVYGWRTQHANKKKNQKERRIRLNQKFFDDFGPYAHEIREYDVKFDPAPVQSSRLYMTNEWDAIVLEYRGDPFGGHWLAANCSRNDAILEGQDAIALGATSPTNGVNQYMMVFGRTLDVQDSQTYVVTNADSVQAADTVESELSNTWIQTTGMAKDIGDWMAAHWGQGVDILEVTVFGNPLIELTDVVHIVYPDKSLDADYFVTGTSNSFDTGLTTTLTLRRVR